MTLRRIPQSKNFTFLESQWPDLAELATFAEMYAFDDPASSLVKLRNFAEKTVDILYYELGLSKPPYGTSFFDLIQDPAFNRAVPSQIVNFLNLIRKEGNKGAHEGRIRLKEGEVIRLLANVHRLSVWLYSTINKESLAIPTFQPPQRPPSREELLKDKEALLERLKALEEAQEAKRKEEPHPAATEDSIEKAHDRGSEQAETIGLTEQQTRKLLIDSLLKDAGWILKPTYQAYDPNTSQPQTLPEYPVEHQPTNSGKGSIDYVLMGKNGKPIAIIEAKKTAKSAELGKTQAELYAHGLEKMTGQRPFIFYTNGHDIFFWDDLAYPPRRVWGFFDQDKLEYLLFQRDNKRRLSETIINTEITGRSYQLECIRRVYEHFEGGYRKALVVMATGTGKTRVAMSLIDGMMRANWAKRILFLVDRLELQRQAVDAFKEHLPNASLEIISSASRGKQDARVYVSTYPSIMNAYADFNAGFFDVIIADESHRSIYNYYKEVFQYFDAFQIGLTATPVDFINRNTFNFFELPDQDPTFHYSLEEAVNNKPPHLVAPKVNDDSTNFLLSGIKYDDLTEEQRQALEDQGEDPQSFQFNREAVDSIVMNRETNRQILRNLMEQGIKDKTGTRPGKTIIFARNRIHAYLLEELFNEMYPEHKGKMAQVIECQNPRANELIDGFKGKKKEFAGLDIAISVDMLDTGIDVPPVVNLVFAKPVYSKVKFWQMIGRGTRLSENLYGPGQHKQYFLIFDPWRNFQFFDIKPDGLKPAEQKSMPERAFHARLELLATLKALAGHGDTQTDDFKGRVLELLKGDIATLPETSVSVKERWKELEQVRKDRFWEKLDDEFFTTLSGTISPLMRWRNITGQDDAMRFDIKIARLQASLLTGNSSVFERYQEEVLEDVERLRTNLNQVKKEIDLIQAVQKANWWRDVSLEKLEDLRIRLRDLMRYRTNNRKSDPKVIDITDPAMAGTGRQLKFEDNMQAYKERLVNVLKELADSNITLQRIRRGMAVTETELESLQALIMQRDPSLKLEDLQKMYPDKADPLDKMIRGIIGMDIVVVNDHFETFRKGHTTLTANQIQFLNLIEQEIVRGGGIEIAKLYEPPFTAIHNQGIDGIFNEAEANEIIDLIKRLAG